MSDPQKCFPLSLASGTGWVNSCGTELWSLFRFSDFIPNIPLNLLFLHRHSVVRHDCVFLVNPVTYRVVGNPKLPGKLSCSFKSQFLRGVTVPAVFNGLSVWLSLASPTAMSWLPLHPGALCQQSIFQSHKQLIAHPKHTHQPITSEGTHSLSSDCLHLVLLLIPSLWKCWSTAFFPSPAGILQAGAALRSQSCLPNLTIHPGQGRDYFCEQKCVIGLHGGEDHPAKGLT